MAVVVFALDADVDFLADVRAFGILSVLSTLVALVVVVVLVERWVRLGGVIGPDAAVGDDGGVLYLLGFLGDLPVLARVIAILNIANGSREL